MRRLLFYSLASLIILFSLSLGGDAADSMRVTATAYSSRESGKITASGKRVRPGMLAVSRDVERLMGLRFGDRVTLGGVPYAIEDRMHKKWKRRVDIYAPSYLQAKHFGIHHGVELRLLP